MKKKMVKHINGINTKNVLSRNTTKEVLTW